MTMAVVLDLNIYQWRPRFLLLPRRVDGRWVFLRWVWARACYGKESYDELRLERPSERDVKWKPTPKR